MAITAVSVLMTNIKLCCGNKYMTTIKDINNDPIVSLSFFIRNDDAINSIWLGPLQRVCVVVLVQYATGRILIIRHLQCSTVL